MHLDVNFLELELRLLVLCQYTRPSFWTFLASDTGFSLDEFPDQPAHLLFGVLTATLSCFRCTQVYTARMTMDRDTRGWILCAISGIGMFHSLV